MRDRHADRKGRVPVPGAARLERLGNATRAGTRHHSPLLRRAGGTRAGGAESCHLGESGPQSPSRPWLAAGRLTGERRSRSILVVLVCLICSQAARRDSRAWCISGRGHGETRALDLDVSWAGADATPRLPRLTARRAPGRRCALPLGGNTPRGGGPRGDGGGRALEGAAAWRWRRRPGGPCPPSALPARARIARPLGPCPAGAVAPGWRPFSGPAPGRREAHRRSRPPRRPAPATPWGSATAPCTTGSRSQRAFQSRAPRG
mmetsp:Transcript_10128/g.29887  ORF Transcript_10128/g.29887 Transcript_10128/m.29887 type:complete len:262 (-) Transcript_10128:1339-2124(-)